MKGMTTQERYNDISQRSGMSVDVVRRVLLAERASIIDSLKRGERATIIGRCTLVPEIKHQVVVGGTLKPYIKVASDTASSLESELKELTDFETTNIEDEDNGVRLTQIPALV